MLHNWVRKKRPGFGRNEAAACCHCRNINSHRTFISNGCRKAFNGK
jgi:hypothetical protein